VLLDTLGEWALSFAAVDVPHCTAIWGTSRKSHLKCIDVQLVWDTLCTAQDGNQERLVQWQLSVKSVRHPRSPPDGRSHGQLRARLRSASTQSSRSQLAHGELMTSRKCPPGMPNSNHADSASQLRNPRTHQQHLPEHHGTTCMVPPLRVMARRREIWRQDRRDFARLWYLHHSS